MTAAAVGLVRKAQDLTASLERLSGLRHASEDLSNLQKRDLQLRGELQRLEPAVRFLRAARLRFPDVPFVPAAEVGKALDLLAGLSTAFSSDPQAILKEEFGHTVAALKKAVTAVEEHARATWCAVSGPVRDEVRRELLDALGRVPSWRTDIAELQRLQLRLSALAELPLADADQFDEFFQIADERQKMWMRLHGGADIPSVVVEFFRACAKDGLPLDRLNEEVVGWLRERSILQHFRVRL